MARTAFFSDERCYWHSADRYAFLAPVGGLVQPLSGPGLPEHPEGKRRLKNLLDVTGLINELDTLSGNPVTDEDLLRIHDASYIADFKRLSAAQGGELGQRTPFGPGGYEIAALSAGLVKDALFRVLDGESRNAYALSRPPGHHCLPASPMGFCLLANIAIAVEAAIAERRLSRVAIVDWDVHHGNGTETIFLDRADVLTISLHQENNYPPDSGNVSVRGIDAGEGHNINVPLPPGAGHDAYQYTFERIVEPALRHFRPDAILVACGYDASGVDPLSRMLATADTFSAMTERVLAIAEDLCDGRVVLAHEGGYSEVHVPFCGHAVIATLASSTIDAPDPLGPRLAYQQPSARLRQFHRELIDEIATQLNSP